MIGITERLTFRELCISDGEAMKHRLNPPFKSINDAINMINHSKTKSHSFIHFRFAVIEKLTDALIGTVLAKEETGKTAVIGFSIGKEFWNKGFGTERLKALLKHLDLFNFKIVQANIHKDNVYSVKLVEKYGFSRKHFSIKTNLVKYEFKFRFCCVNLIK